MFRPILDLRRLNRFLKRLPFRMLRTADVIRAIEPGAWFITIDLKEAYFHVPIAVEHRQFLRFSFLHKTYQFRVLPFGLSLAPRVFTKFIQVALEPLQQEGILVLPYLDDWLLYAATPEQATANANHLLHHVTALGLRVNWEKSCLLPAQSVNFLGMHLDSRAMRANLTGTRLEAIQHALARVRTGHRTPYIQLLRLAGLLTAATTVIQLGLLHLRPFQRWLIALRLSAVHHRRTMVRVTDSCSSCLLRWRQEDFLLSEVSMGPPPACREVVTTDASSMGWGGVWQRQGVSGQWDPHMRRCHINVLELQAVFLTLKHFEHALVGKHVSQDRQHLSGVSHKSSGRHEVSPLPSAGTGTSDLGRDTPPVPTCETHSRSPQHRSGLAVPRGTKAGKLAAAQRNRAANLEHVRCGSSGLVCLEGNHTLSPVVCRTGGVSWQGCSVPRVARPLALCLPTDTTYLGSAQSGSGNGPQSAFDRSQVAEHAMVSLVADSNSRVRHLQIHDCQRNRFSSGVEFCFKSFFESITIVPISERVSLQHISRDVVCLKFVPKQIELR